uniref:Uncharacterized protein n=1 Tax=Rhizophora mucronata TaxID=61149 RepID=A0A2P2Q8P8_RHIMU
MVKIGVLYIRFLSNNKA